MTDDASWLPLLPRDIILSEQKPLSNFLRNLYLTCCCLIPLGDRSCAAERMNSEYRRLYCNLHSRILHGQEKGIFRRDTKMNNIRDDRFVVSR
mgnify:CR=1 FL=1